MKQPEVKGSLLINWYKMTAEFDIVLSTKEVIYNDDYYPYMEIKYFAIDEFSPDDVFIQISSGGTDA